MYIWQNKAKIMKLIKGEPLNDGCLDVSVAVGVKPNMPDTSPIRHANIRGRGYYH
jgi:hypothetical protein